MIIDVVAAIIRRGERILITQRFDNVHLPGLWEFPGGKVEAGESLQAALEREIREELGLQIRVHDEFFTTEHDYPTKSVRLHFFNSSIIEGEPRLIDVADLRWVLPQDLDQFEFPEADADLIARLNLPS
ncbi:MAG TPA: (deoxy)nucleoside triphosphate pyrophosphohydrolase [Terriglobia bacterium]|nr:(deoxy)nucleoside triphosphate pyrophosphohydrolase [Terriglobia bacterium]